MSELAFNIPVNPVSFGQVSTLLLRTLFEQCKDPISLFPIGGVGRVDLSSQSVPKEFELWLKQGIDNAEVSHSRKNPIFKLWHLFGSLESFSERQALLTFYELDEPTKLELNSAKNNSTFVTNRYTQEIFRQFGVDVGLIPLAFDKFNFSKLNRQYFHDGRIVFNLCGKLEKRKHHAPAIKAWIKRFGNNKKYSLQCAIYNSFLQPQANQQVIAEILGGSKPFNVAFVPQMQENNTYNDFLNSGNIIIGASGAEGWGLPEFHSVAIGKHSVIMNAHGYKDWANEKNSCLFSPGEKVDAYDNMFFKKGNPVNQGRIFGFNEDSFIAQCEEAIKRFENNPINEMGLELQDKFSCESLLENVKSALKSLS